MPDLSLGHLGLLAGTSVLAGIIDTLAGGGGLITVPALLFSGVSPVLALGTNKFQSCLCESSATLVFHKKNKIRLGALKSGLCFTLLGSLLGTLLLQVTEVELLKRLVPFLLLAVFLLNLFTKNFPIQKGNEGFHSPLFSRLIRP